MKKLLLIVGLPAVFAAIILLSPAICRAQNVTYHYSYKFEAAVITEPPNIISSPEFKYPDEARKNAVEGKVILTFTLGDDSKVRDIKTVQSLPNGVTEALITGVQNMRFMPARNNGVPTPVEVTLEIRIDLVFSEGDPNVKMPKLTFLPAAVYPEIHRAAKHKGTVTTRIVFYADGTMKVAGMNSFLPKEFDNSALEAAKQIKFEPATHKKSRKPVSQAMIVEFEFKP